MTAIVQRTRRHHVPAARTVSRRPAARPPTVPATGGALRRRRAVAGIVAVGALSVVGLGANGVLSGPGDVPASAAGAGPAPVAQTVTVHAGDTLWSIAERHRGSVPIQRYVDALVRLNGGTTEIDAGQLIRLP